MGLRTYKRQIAKARLQVIGAGNVNKKMSKKNPEGVPTWKLMLSGKTGQEAHRAQMNLGKLIKAKDDSKRRISKRKIRKVETA